MKKYFTNKEQKEDEIRIDKLIKKYTKENGYTDEELLQFNKTLIQYLAGKKKIQTADIPLHEYAIEETGEIIYITREHSLELKRNGHKLIPIPKEIEEKITNTNETINLTIDLTKVKREKWADECWNGKNLINTKSNLPKGNGIINEEQ